ncbi:DUF1499 domain-containing protein [Profundibacterium mesophilum]|uniref:DUF1499 domain-containing protein n=1 Tax=Profundibacterium mesophilum KAUST100406-0324 TaxID=1037889 RepID=A0A921NTK0_9RHOB|nr:DUF1499 domain-containing protein [Profundibacterium mesophilum]KAF0674921.1 uncharacterized protein PMES_02629 [Profundibacterium mesophilum KAUST100406-0324]
MLKFLGLATLFLLLAILAAIALAMVLIRLAGSEASRWHVDPALAASGREGGWTLRPEGGDAVGPRARAAPEALLRMLDEIALEEPRTRRLAGSPGEGRITYVTRSLLFGFPDYTTVAAVPHPDGGHTVLLDGRLRFGKSDLGVNRARAKRWMERLRTRLAREGTLAEPGPDGAR